jgi:hypothetical protein
MSAATEDFWKSLKGILARLADLSHHLTWSTLNTGIRETVAAIEPIDPETGEPHKLLWATMEDEKVCDYCNEQEGEYDFDDPLLPAIPAHVMCRCWWTIEVE